MNFEVTTILTRATAIALALYHSRNSAYTNLAKTIYYTHYFFGNRRLEQVTPADKFHCVHSFISANSKFN